MTGANARKFLAQIVKLCSTYRVDAAVAIDVGLVAGGGHEGEEGVRLALQQQARPREVAELHRAEQRRLTSSVDCDTLSMYICVRRRTELQEGVAAGLEDMIDQLGGFFLGALGVRSSAHLDLHDHSAKAHTRSTRTKLCRMVLPLSVRTEGFALRRSSSRHNVRFWLAAASSRSVQPLASGAEMSAPVASTYFWRALAI